MNSPRASSPASEALESRHGSDEIPEPGDNEPKSISSVSRIKDVRTSQAFVQCLKEARLEDSGLEEEDIERLRNPTAILINWTIDTSDCQSMCSWRAQMHLRIRTRAFVQQSCAATLTPKCSLTTRSSVASNNHWRRTPLSRHVRQHMPRIHGPLYSRLGNCWQLARFFDK